MFSGQSVFSWGSGVAYRMVRRTLRCGFVGWIYRLQMLFENTASGAEAPIMTKRPEIPIGENRAFQPI